MYIWTFDGSTKAFGAGVLTLALTGCLGIGPAPTANRQGAGAKAASFLGNVLKDGDSGASQFQQMVANGAVVVRGPQGYCVDRRASNAKADTAFVMLAPCSADRTSGDAGPRRRALLTASITPGPGPEVADYGRFLSSPQGRAALSQSGNAQSVAITTAESRGDMYLLHVTDDAMIPDRGLRPETWRAFFSVNGNIVSLTAFGLETAPMSIDGGFALLERFADAIRNASPDLTGGSVVASVAPAPQPQVGRNLAFAD